MRLTVKTPILYLSIIDSLNPDPWEIFHPGRSGVLVREIQTDQKRIIILFFRKSKIQKLLRMSSI